MSRSYMNRFVSLETPPPGGGLTPLGSELQAPAVRRSGCRQRWNSAKAGWSRASSRPGVGRGTSRAAKRFITPSGAGRPGVGRGTSRPAKRFITPSGAGRPGVGRGTSRAAKRFITTARARSGRGCWPPHGHARSATVRSGRWLHGVLGGSRWPDRRSWCRSEPAEGS